MNYSKLSKRKPQIQALELYIKNEISFLQKNTMQGIRKKRKKKINPLFSLSLPAKGSVEDALSCWIHLGMKNHQEEI